VVCVVPDLAAATRFYKQLGFKKSDEIYAFIDAHFFHCNPRHHSLALTEIPRVRGLHHIMVQLREFDDVGVAYDLVQSRGIPLTMTLGRHPNDRMVSFYVRSPSGFEIEYGWGALEVGDDWTVTQYDAVSVWGHKMVGTSPPGALEEAL
jgi:extradiol dioxygenase